MNDPTYEQHEDQDSEIKRLNDRIRDLEAENRDLINFAYRLEAIQEAIACVIDGEEVSEFSLSNPIVLSAMLVRYEADKVHFLKAENERLESENVGFRIQIEGLWLENERLKADKNCYHEDSYYVSGWYCPQCGHFRPIGELPVYAQSEEDIGCDHSTAYITTGGWYCPKCGTGVAPEGGNHDE